MMKKKQLINKVAAEAGLPQRMSESFINALVDVIIDELKQRHTVRIEGLVDFIPKFRHSRKGINPITKEPIVHPDMIVPKLKPGHTLKKALRQIKIEGKTPQ